MHFRLAARLDAGGVRGYNDNATGRSSVWLERYLGVVEAAGSSPVAPTIIISQTSQIDNLTKNRP